MNPPPETTASDDLLQTRRQLIEAHRQIAEEIAAIRRLFEEDLRRRREDGTNWIGSQGDTRFAKFLSVFWAVAFMVLIMLFIAYMVVGLVQQVTG